MDDAALAGDLFAEADNAEALTSVTPIATIGPVDSSGAIEVLDAGDDDASLAASMLPSIAGPLELLIARDRSTRAAIHAAYDAVNGSTMREALHYFLTGNASPERGQITLSLSFDALFRIEGALAALDASSWQAALDMTGLLSIMPAARANEWKRLIREHSTPTFDESTVRATLADLLASWQTFFAERIDGLFRALSRSHVTNRPEGFSKRMIISRMLNSWGCVESDRESHIHDLRGVVARFTGRDEPTRASLNPIMRMALEKIGQWVSIDGGTIRLRVHKVGTAHLDIHPDMAWRLNGMLAHLYPMAIPSSFRTRPKKQSERVAPVAQMLSTAVVEALCEFKTTHDYGKKDFHGYAPPMPNWLQGGYALRTLKEHVRRGVDEVLRLLGGVQHPGDRWEFDYPPTEVLREVIVTASVPDARAHEFHETAADLAQECVDEADIGPHDLCLEPSAGRGAIAQLMPAERTTCVELAPVFARLLAARGLEVVQEDFVTWARTTERRFTRVVMNPPFSRGQALEHLRAAASLLTPGGRVVAVLPASLVRNDALVPGMRQRWIGGVRSGLFTTASVNVCVVAIDNVSDGV